MKMAKEDLLEIRKLLASRGVEHTPDELAGIFKEVEPDFQVTNEPGIKSILDSIKELDQDNKPYPKD